MTTSEIVLPVDLDLILSNASSSAIANQESLSGLETEMRKLEGVVKEIVDEMEYLKTREERFQSTNSTSLLQTCFALSLKSACVGSVDEQPRTKLRVVHDCLPCWAWCLADLPPARVLQAQIPHRLGFTECRLRIHLISLFMLHGRTRVVIQHGQN